MIHVYCQCGGRLSLATDNIGRLARCPACAKHIRAVASNYQEGQRGFDALMVVQSGPRRAGEQIFLGGETPIEVGKLDERHIVLASKGVSRMHCRILRTEYGWRIEDANSTNGVYVNDHRKKAHNLLEGDRVRIGEFHLQFHTAAPPAEQAAAGIELTVEGGNAAAQSAQGEGMSAGAQTSESDEALTFIEDVALLSMTSTTTMARPESLSSDEDDGDLRFAEDDFEPPPLPRPASRRVVDDDGPGPTCPSCGKVLAARAKICTECGVDVKTGRSLTTAYEKDLDETYSTVERAVWWLSWIFWFGVYPVASEAFGKSRPYVTRAIAIVTILVSGWYLAVEIQQPRKMMSYKNLMLWAGDGPPDAELVYLMYQFTDYGDGRLFEHNLTELHEKNEELADDAKLTEDQLILQAHEMVPRERQCFGEFHGYQLITHALLHGGVIHLVGNLIFLMVLGSRVNALVGHVWMIVLYPLLAVGAALTQMASVAGQPPAAMLGASGAVMGLAGMYMILFPAHKVHMVAWLRWGLLAGFHLSASIFTVRGFWVVLFYISFDVVMTLLAVEDGVAHWAHLGGFIVGAVLAIVMLVTRAINARGGDIFSVLLGRHAWAIVGRPRA